MDPHCDISMHRHPHADTFEYFLSGEGLIVINNTTFKQVDLDRENRLIPISRLDWHGGKTGTIPSIFLSIQIWDDEIMAVTNDWEALLDGEAIAKPAEH